MLSGCRFPQRADNLIMDCAGQLRLLDNCEIFFQLRYAFQTYNQNGKSLKTFLYWSGNEEAITELCDICIDILLEHKLILIKTDGNAVEQKQIILPNDDEPGAKDRLRSVLVYLILNSANVYKCEDEQLGQWNPHCVHLLKQLPHALPQFLTLALVLKCGLIDVFGEFLTYAPPKLTGQYYACLNETLSHVTKDHFESLELLCLALKSAGLAMGCQKEEATVIVLQLAKLLQRHLLDSVERLRVLRPASRRLYLGQAITQLMVILINTLHFEKDEGNQLPYFFPLFQLRLKVEIPKVEHNQELSHTIRFALVLLDSLQNLVQVVSVDTFIYWLELPSQKPLYNLQERICLLSSELINILVENNQLKLHSICKQLDSFAQAAKTFEERLAEVPLGKLLSFLDGEEGEATEAQLVSGLEQLFQRSIAFGNDECVDTMAKHIKLMKFTHAQKIIEHLGEVAKAKEMLMFQGVSDEGITIKNELDEQKADDADDEDEQQEYAQLISQVLYPIFVQSSFSEQIQLLNQRGDLQLLGHFRFDVVGQEDQRILFFNQFSMNSQSLPLKEFLQFCFTNPVETWLSLAQLAMAHEGFALIFWRLACLCSGHVFHYIPEICTDLIRDERMLHNENCQNFLLSLYIYPLILNGLKISFCLRKNRRYLKLRLNLKGVNYPYTPAKLKSAQSDFLEAFALSLEKFSDSNTNSYAIICKLMSILMAIKRLDEYLAITSKKELSLLITKKMSQDDLNIAKKYTKMHVQLAQWRRSNWILISQLIQTMDLLRWDLTCFNSTRVDALNLVVAYWKQNTLHAYLMPQGLCEKIHAMVDTMDNKFFWLSNDMLLDHNLDVKATVSLLTQASASEAKVLLRNAVICSKDKTIMSELSLAVSSCGPESSESALSGYNFLFKCYIKAFKTFVPHNIKPGTCVRLVERLLEVVSQSPEPTWANILHMAQSTLITLFIKSSNADAKDKIIQYMKLMPQNASTEIITKTMENLIKPSHIVDQNCDNSP